MNVSVKAKGKAIITGEHSVVYGAPAIAQAINLSAETIISPADKIQINLVDYDISCEFTGQDFYSIKQEREEKYQQYQKGNLEIVELVSSPVDIFKYIVASLLRDKKEGINVSLSSKIPIGSGLGSSSATKASLVKAINEYFSLDLSLEQQYEIVYKAELLHIGKSSGIDPYLAVNGGAVYFKNKKATEHPTINFPFKIVNSGTPLVNTGEVVEAVKPFLTQKILQEFERVTENISKAVKENNYGLFCKSIDDNEELLEAIGVVPNKVKDFISKLKKLGISAKVSGAGAHKGDNGGIVLCFTEQDLTDSIKKFSYEEI